MRVVGRWLAFRPRGGDGVRIAAGRYRGRILVHLNRRGTLNLINEVDFEDYLRGVVPREMGPEVFDNLEALKAQAVAARTYTLRNLGEFAGEGYDICATPRCQVYGGMDVEHPLSDRAVRETAGEVLVYGGELVDARYSSTCGGHTEDMRVVFPERDEPYLGRGALPRGGGRPAGRRSAARRGVPRIADPAPAARHRRHRPGRAGGAVRASGAARRAAGARRPAGVARPPRGAALCRLAVRPGARRPAVRRPRGPALPARRAPGRLERGRSASWRPT